MLAREQLELLPREASPAVRRGWLALPFRDTRACSSCGAVGATTAGKRRSSQRCVTCFALQRRRGHPGAF